MRYLMKVTLPVEASNKVTREGKLGETINEILDEMNPEAAYFSDIDGCRGGYIIFQMDDVSEIPKVAEPWFLAFDAEVELHPVMLPEDLGKAVSHIERAVKKYG